MEAKDLILFQIADLEYGMGISYVQGVETYVKIVPIANADECIEGIVDIRGDVIPIYNLRKKFQLAEVPVTEFTKFIIAKMDDRLVGFKVDNVTGMRNILENDIFDVPKVMNKEETSYIDFIVRREGKLCVVIKPEQLLDEVEKGKIKDAVSQFDQSSQ